MDQLERIGAAIVTAINKVNRSIQKTSVYISANTYSLAPTPIVAVAGVSGTEASTKVIMEFVGSATGIGDGEGSLEISMKLVGEVDLSAGDADGVLNAIMEFVGEVDLAVAGADGTLRDVTRLISSIDTVGVGDADGSLDSQPGLTGLAEALTNAFTLTLRGTTG